VHGSREVERAINGYNNKLDSGVWDEITEFVAERDPKKIAVNTSDWLAKADGISYSQYVRLEKILGPRYSKRIVSAENVITHFRTRRTLREVTLMTNALEIHRQILERALSNEVITPGVTTLQDIGWWVKEEFYKRNLTRGYSKAETPIVLYSAVSDQPDIRGIPANDGSFSSSNSPQYVVQRGDFLQFDNGIRYLDYFGTDYKRNAYIMREGETKVPDGIQHAFDRAIAARTIIREHIKIGKTGGQILRDIIAGLKAADYIYTPFTDESPENYMNVQEKLAHTDKSSFSIDLHGQGNEQHGGSLVAVGPYIAAFRSDRDHLRLQENHIFSFESLI
jgi:Xaa-Pro dipeptidase